jgi:hypothetical protein
MKKIPVLCLAVAFFCCLFNVQTVRGQKVVAGDMAFLKGQKSINVIFDFTGLKIEKETEAEFLTREIAERNKKEAGSGDKFKEDWEKDKTDRLATAFIKVLGEETGIKVDDPNAKYTLIVYDIDLTNKGWGNKFSGGNPASMDVDFKFVETAYKDGIQCQLRSEKVRYMATMGTLSQKIQGCLEFAARQVAKTMKKSL